MPRLRLPALLIACALPAAAIAAEGAATDTIEQGRVILEENCGRCHATGAEGDSPLPAAPQFRTLGRKYPVSDLAEALVEGILTGHPEMPEFSFEPDQVDAVIAYLESIQVK